MTRATIALATIANLLAIFLFAAAPARAQSRQIGNPVPNYGQIFTEVTPEKGLEILTDFRNRSIEGDYYLEFQLRLLPRRGDATVIPGRLWGSRNNRGPITRVTLWPDSAIDEQQLLVQNGPESTIWSWARNDAMSGAKAPGATNDTAATARLDQKAMLESIAGTELTPFDLQMPFIYWADFTYEGIKPALGRPAYTFVMRPPAELASTHPELQAVRIHIDTSFRAITVFEILGPKQTVIKTLTLKEFQQVNGQWLFRKIEIINNTTRNKADLTVVVAGTKLHFSSEIFNPAKLSTPIGTPPTDTLWKLQ